MYTCPFSIRCKKNQQQQQKSHMQLKLNDGLLIRWYAKERTDKKEKEKKEEKSWRKIC